MDAELRKWLQLPIVGRNITLQSTMVEAPSGRRVLRVITYLDGEAFDILSDMTDSPEFNAARAAMREIERGMRAANEGHRFYTFEIMTRPEPGGSPGEVMISVQTTLPDERYNPNDPLQPLMSMVGQYATDLLNLIKRGGDVQFNKEIRPPGHLDANAPQQAGGQDSAGTSD